ncbi:DNA polymerase III subunit alpha [Falsibacillus albus]|uniref:DNA polymerase III subunit alpha n=1 Tax=Falsibacillus albus TaxID=2478915 RepID=A0A3L7K4F2_9BACI|nr:DNA polymerase III subunit alpha [Falsibacillus albus]RLQ97956.1 DNA polymerase III subunit alpha [Falsibacillus albus]
MSFIHLQVSTSYSLLSSTISIEELVQQAKKMHYEALAITDRNVMYGSVPFYKACMNHGIKPIIGLEADVLSEIQPGQSYPLVLLAKNNEGYQNLLKISSVIQTKSEDGIPLKWLKAYSAGLFALTPGNEGEIEYYIAEDEVDKAKEAIQLFKNIFERESFYLSLQQHNKRDVEHSIPQIRCLASELNVPTIITNDVKYLSQADSFAHECLMAIREGKVLADEDRPRLDSNEYYFKTKSQMAELFSDDVEALENTIKVADSCKVNLSFHKRLLPKFPLEGHLDPHAMLKEQCERGLESRGLLHKKIYQDRLHYELGVIRNMEFSDYFLIVWDFMKYAREKGILTGPGRGSSAGSLVAYSLQITDVDPIDHGLIFERFLNPERITMPDIDIDFPDHRRDEVLQYVAAKYGTQHVAQIITFGTLAAKASMRDVAKVFGCNSKELEQISRLLPSKPGLRLTEVYEQNPSFREFIAQTELYKKMFSTAVKLEGLPRHASTHAAGVVISDSPLVQDVPLQSGQGNLSLTQYSMDILEEIGLLKMDFLGLRNLSILERIIQSIQRGTGRKVNLREIPFDDKETYDLLSKGDTTGVFQLESDGMRKVLMKLKPSRFEDIVAVNALYRPGPMENIPLYIDRKHGLKTVDYPHEDLKEILEMTYGVIVYQEQIMQIAYKMAGFSLGEADLLRRAVSKKKKEVLDEQRNHFVKGALTKGYDQKNADQIYDLIVRFSNYGFPRGHAVAYSVIAYQLAYLKTHYPIYFMASLLTSVVGNEDKVAQYIKETKLMGIYVLPPSINKSHFAFSVENGSIRFSLAAIKGVGVAALRAITENRQGKKYQDLFDFCVRVPIKAVNRKTIEALIFSGGFDEFGKDRAVLLASLDAALEHGELLNPDDQDYNLFEDENSFQLVPKYTDVEAMPLLEKLNFERQAIGLYLSDHPVSPYKEVLDHYGTVYINDLSIGEKNVSAGGYITSMKTIRTKKGQVMAFMTVSDQWGDLECVLFPTVYSKNSAVCQQGNIVIIQGKIEDRNEKKQMIVQQVKTIDQVKEELADSMKKLYLKVTPSFQNSRELHKVQSTLRKYHGSTRVIMYYESDDKIIQLGKKDWVNASKGCLEELETLLGKDNVILKQ